MRMKEIKIKESSLKAASQEGIDAFIKVFTDAIYETIGGTLNAATLPELNADQVTLLAYVILRDAVMDGEFVELIHNGYGPFIFRNPFDKAMRNWGLHDLYKIINKCHKLFNIHQEALEKDCTQEEFDALYELFPEFDDYDDAFVENEEHFTTQVANYVDGHIENFCTIVYE